MKLEYSFTEGDYLAQLLYSASKSEKIQKVRKRAKLLLSAVYLTFPVVLLFYSEYIFACVLLVFIAIFMFIFYPKSERKQYIKRYKKIINENRKSDVGKIISVEINDEFYTEKDGKIELKISISEIKEIISIPTLFLLKISETKVILIPKNQISDSNEVRLYLIDLSKKYNINYINDENWEWK